MQAKPTNDVLRPGVRPRVFISYRREDSRHVAGRLADHLNASFDLFMDVEDIDPGTDFTQALQNAVRSSQVLLALIGPSWANVRDQAGRRRIDDPADWVANEIWAGLSRKITVIPVLVDDARMPRSEELPPMLAGLSSRQAFTLRHESFNDDAARLVRDIERALALPAAGSGIATLTRTPPPTRPGGGRRLGLVLGAIIAAVVAAVLILVGVLNSDPPVPTDGPTSPTPTKGTTRRPTPARSATPSARPIVQLTVGQTAEFTNFKVTVATITTDPAFGVLVDANVCLIRDNNSDGRSRISWDPWTVTDRNGHTYKPGLADPSHPPTTLFPQEQTVPVGTCVHGLIPFGDVPATEQVASTSYRNGLGDRARWTP